MANMAPMAPKTRGTRPPGRLVYSSASGARATKPPLACRRCGADPCRCEAARSVPPGEHEVRVRRETAGRGGKTVTVAAPLRLVRHDAAALLAALKRVCGSGGTLKTAVTRGGDPCFEVEFQGDHAERLVAELTRAGYPTKRAGG
jgi:translation initiation factor 1